MPVYQYKCQSCSLQFELKQSFNDISVVSCPECQNQARRLFYPAPIIFKGQGFYTTDNRRQDSNKGQKESKPWDQTKEDDED